MEIEKRLLQRTTLGMMNGGQMLQNAGEQPDNVDNNSDPATQTVESSEPPAASSDSESVTMEENTHLAAARDTMEKFIEQPIAVKDAIKGGVNTVVNGAIDQTRKAIGAIPFVGGLLGDAWDTLGTAKEVGKGTLIATLAAAKETLRWPTRPAEAGYHFARFLADKALSKIRR